MNKGRIIKGVGGLYYIASDGIVYECSARGKFRKAKITPTTGDYAGFTILDREKRKGSLDVIEKRKNILIRPRVANIDCAVITFAAASPDINRDILDRFLVLAEERNIPEVIICINKCELAKKGLYEELQRIYGRCYTVVFTSAEENKGIYELKALLRGKVSVFAGPSGVGKSSIINRIIPESNRQTGEISRKIERGKHTTRQVELLETDDNTYIADSPGFTSLNLEHIRPEQLQYYFREFREYIDKCRFADCAHIHEPDCIIKENIGKTIAQERYDAFVYLCDELRSYQ